MFPERLFPHRLFTKYLFPKVGANPITRHGWLVCAGISFIPMIDSALSVAPYYDGGNIEVQQPIDGTPDMQECG